MTSIYDPDLYSLETCMCIYELPKAFGGYRFMHTYTYRHRQRKLYTMPLQHNAAYVIDHPQSDLVQCLLLIYWRQIHTVRHLHLINHTKYKMPTHTHDCTTANVVSRTLDLKSSWSTRPYEIQCLGLTKISISSTS